MLDNFFFRDLSEKSSVKLGKNSVISNLSKEILDGPMRGWLCGHFYPKDSIFHRNDIEICLKRIPLKITEEEHYHLCSFEFLIVLNGLIEYTINGEKNILKQGSFYILEPGETEFISNVIEEATILAIRLPSIPNNKIHTSNNKEKI